MSIEFFKNFLYLNYLLGTQQNSLSDAPCLSHGTEAEQD